MAGKATKGKAKVNHAAQTKSKSQTGNKMQIKNQITGDWLYFCPEEISVRDIYEVFADTVDAEIWEEAGVLELLLTEKSTLDIETAQIHPKDEITQNFAKEQGAKCVFLATFLPEDYLQAEQMMRQLLEKFGGIFCGDTEDFTPVIQ